MNDTRLNITGNEPLRWYDDDVGVGDGFGDGLGVVFEFDFMPEDLSESARTTFCVLYVAIIVLGLAGNCMTALVVAVNSEMRTTTNVFLVSLAVSDALIAGINMPLQLRLYQQNEWTLGQAACKLGAYSQGVVIVASILTLISLAIDRYYAICHPLRARNVHTIRRALVSVVIIWATSLLLLSPQLFIQRLEPVLVMQPEHDPPIRVAQVCVEYFSDKRLRIAYTSFFYVAVYLVPVLTMFATYGRIAVTLWRRRPIGDSPDTLRDSHRRLKEKKRIVCMLVLIMLLFAVSWFPFFTVQLYFVTDDTAHRSSTIRTTAAILQLLGYSNCCVNPVIYCFINDSFQRNLLQTLRCRCAASHTGRVTVGGGRPATPLSGARVGRGSGGVEMEMKAMVNGGEGLAVADTGTTALSDEGLRTTAELPSTVV